MITKSIFRRFAWVGIATGLLLSVSTLSAQEKQFSLNENVGKALQGLKALQDAKNYQGMVELVETQLKSVPPTSYDAAYLLDLRAKVYLALASEPNAPVEQLLGKVVESWEQYLKLSRQHGYFDEKSLLETTKTLGQMVFYAATAIKDKDQQSREIDRAAAYLSQYTEETKKQGKKLDADVLITLAQIFFVQASADQNTVNQPQNQAKLAQAREYVEKAMLVSVRPKERDFMTLLAIVEQQNSPAVSAEIMEMFLSMYPQKKDIWTNLFGRYVGLASSSPQGSKIQRDYTARAINTIERAQALGFMNEPRDNFNLFTLYANAGQNVIATDFLYNSMKKGKIESTPTNWKYLASLLQQDNKELQAVAALQEAIKLFPEDGSLEFLVGEIYRTTEKYREAAQAYERALAKNVEKPHQALLFLAYMQFELREYDNALATINKAAADPVGAKDGQVKNLKEGIESTIADLKAQREAREAAAKRRF